MKRLSLLACASLLAAAMASPSFAADLPRPNYTKAPIYVAPFSWTGFYVGINGGYGWGTATLSNALGTATSSTQSGALAGGTVGYNLQTGVWVWGIEGDLDYAWIKGNTSNTGGSCVGGGPCTITDSFFSTVRGRVGYAMDRFMPYLTGGAAFSSIKISAPSGASNRSTNTGWTAGAGLEYAFLGGWSAKIEYLYAAFGSNTCDTSVCTISTDYKSKVNVARIGVNYRF
jgi:outer membrane immunogenic protein